MPTKQSSRHLRRPAFSPHSGHACWNWPPNVPTALTPTSSHLSTHGGPAKLLIPEQAAVLDDEPDRARQLARSHIRRYLPLPNYVANLRRLGFTDDDFTDDGSDRLVDAIVAHGDPETINSRVRAHYDAGATNVCVQLLSPAIRRFPIDQWRVLLS